MIRRMDGVIVGQQRIDQVQGCVEICRDNPIKIRCSVKIKGFRKAQIVKGAF